MKITSIFLMVFLTVIMLLIHLAWKKGKLEIKSMNPSTQADRLMFVWIVVFTLNFIFFFCSGLDMNSAFPLGGYFYDGHYHVSYRPSSTTIYTPIQYYLSYAHGIIFSVVFMICAFKLKKMISNKSSEPTR
ncbi:MAG: hypothetical protein WCG03_10825 [Kiritimatiellales bacterium]